MRRTHPTLHPLGQASILGQVIGFQELGNVLRGQTLRLDSHFDTEAGRDFPSGKANEIVSLWTRCL